RGAGRDVAAGRGLGEQRGGEHGGQERARVHRPCQLLDHHGQLHEPGAVAAVILGQVDGVQALPQQLIPRGGQAAGGQFGLTGTGVGDAVGACGERGDGLGQIPMLLFQCKGHDLSRQIRSMMTAVVEAEAQIATSAVEAPRRSSSLTAVASRRMPVAPAGWPSAIAPPLTLSLSWSTPSSIANDSGTEAKASLTSNRSMSATVMPAWASTLRPAAIGPSSRVSVSPPTMH